MAKTLLVALALSTPEVGDFFVALAFFSGHWLAKCLG